MVTFGPGHQQLDHILGAVHTAGRRQTGANSAVENSYPGQRQAKSLRRAQQNVRFDLKLSEVDVRLIEAVEHNQIVGSRFIQAVRHI